MPKIDFDSDSAPFSGAVLPTIEDVAALGDRLEKEVVDPVPRMDPARATTVQRMVLPFTFILVAAAAVVLHLALPSEPPAPPDDSASPAPPSVPPELIPLEGVRDLRVIVLVPSERDVDLALRGARSARVTIVHSKEAPVPRRETLAAARVSFYPVPASMVPSEGALLDGLRWYPLRPAPPPPPSPPTAPPSAPKP